jgi:hypothetical protein
MEVNHPYCGEIFVTSGDELFYNIDIKLFKRINYNINFSMEAIYND